MNHDLSFSHVPLSDRQFIGDSPTPFGYVVLESNNLANFNMMHESDRSTLSEFRALSPVARSTIDSSIPSATLSLKTLPQDPPSRTTTPRARAKAKKVLTDVNFVKRPLNSFMLYRKDNQHNIPTNNHQSISRIIGDMWRKETAETKNFYDVRAKEEREKHLLQHPGYKFQPKKKKKETKASRPEPKSRQSPAGIHSHEPTIVPASYDQQDGNLEPPEQTEQPFNFSTLLDENFSTVLDEPQQSLQSRTAACTTWSSYQHEGEHYSEPGNQHELPLHYAHYTGQVQYMDTQVPTNYQEPHGSGAMLKDPQDWNILSNQCHYAASAALYPHQAHANQPGAEAQWPESYNSLDYNMPATFSEWENMRMAEMPMLQQGLETEYPYHHEQDMGFPSHDAYDEQDFMPNHMKHNDMLLFAPTELKGSWEVEHVESQLYQF
ncbi:Transcription factor ste11 [Taphrina deformans PYCC 5710]|uniref:Transcription factor ste11 n=1 Tax=Taphrina deformans (strain PYCC 5710 / ATCC 11124 / CBS 356.35 / IMI 108563 / JCM 9778 / NBRC 8474) TaxID=1097556 RepID=R4XFM8_TAPDE|nr:Transcription factor ste11 [Taphrina deformans PYCC 5710]|eukprot:CCG83292.1 Transcription factor ste11 [Taphrina deformans PYCC 5710]